MSSISVVNVENELLKKKGVSIKPISYLLVSKVSEFGVRVVAVFSDYDKAFSYMIRSAVNDCRDEYEDYLDGEVLSEESYADFIRSQINDYDEIIPIHHIDLTKPVYVMKDNGYVSKGDPYEYVTNSEVYWDAKMKSSYTRTKREKREGVSIRVPKDIKDYLLNIDPPLPELQPFKQPDQNGNSDTE